MRKAVVIDRDYGSVTVAELEQLRDKLLQKGIDLKLCHCASEDQIISEAQGCAMLLCTGNPPVTEKVLRALPSLRAVLRFGIGVNSVDLETATAQGVAVLNMPGFCINELAVHATAMILAMERNLFYYDSRIRQGKWPKATGNLPRAPRNMTLGLYGFGGSAKELYKIFRMGFDSRVITCDPYVPEEARSGYDVEFVDFDTLLAQSDIVSVHAPLTPETRHIFNMDAFRKMKNDAILINIARGELVDQKALEQALQEGQIRYAGLDVFEQEPLSADSGLRNCENAVLSCHSAFYGVESKAKQLELAYEITRKALNENGLLKRNIVNRDVIPTLIFELIS